jgi:hypothetical protein
MGFIDDIKEGVDDVKEGAGDVVDEVKEGDLGGAVDEAQDTVEDVASGRKDSGSNNSGSGGSEGGSSGSQGGNNTGGGSGPIQNAIDTAKNTIEDSTGLDLGGSDGSNDAGSPAEGKPSGSKKPSDNVDSGSQGNDNAPQTQEQLKQFLGLGKQKTVDAGKKLEKFVNETEAKDNDIINNDFAKTGGNLFETGAERELSQAKGFQGESFNSKAFNNSLRAESFFTGQDRIEQGQNQLDKLNKQIDTVRNAESSTVLLDTNGPQEGGVKEVSKNQALEILKEDKTGLQEDIDKIQKNQVQRIENIGKVNDQIEKDRNTITEKEAETIAKNQDLSKKGGQIAFFGKKLMDTKGGLAEASMIFDTALSKRSGELLGASVDQFIGSDEGDKTVETVAEKNSILAGQRVEKQGFDPVDEGVDTLTSIPGIVGTSLVGGAVFSGGSKVVGALPKIGSQAQKLYQAGGVALGGYTLAKQGNKAKNQFQAGNETEGIATVTETGAGLTGFYKGSKAFNSRFGRRTGTTSINQKNLLRSSGKSDFSGFGKFRGETNIVNTKVRRPYSSENGFQLPAKTVREGTVETTGRYSITGGRSSSQGQGKFQVQYPSGGSRTGNFEFLSNIKSRGTTRSGNKYSLSSDTTRFQTEGKLFRYFKDQQGLSKSIKQGQERVSPTEVLNNFERVPSISKDAQAQKVSLSTTNAQGNKFGSVENYVLRAGGSSSSASGSGSTVTTGRGKLQGTGLANSRFRGLAESEASSFAQSQNPSGSTFTSISSSSSSQSTQETGGSGGSQNQANTFTSLGSEGLESFRERAYSQRQVSIPQQENTGTQQKQDGSVGSTVSIGGTGSTTSTAKRRKQDFKDRTGLKTGQDLGLGTSQGQDNKLGVGSIGRTKNRGVQRQDNRLEDLGKVGTGITGKVGTTPGLKTGTLQIPELKNPQKTQNRTLLQSATTTTPAQRVTPKAGGGLVLPSLDSRRSGPSFKGNSSGSRAGISGSLKTDWFSANLVEQTSDEEAKFDLSTAPASNPLFGLKTTQEQKGKTPTRQNIDLDIEIY